MQHIVIQITPPPSFGFLRQGWTLIGWRTSLSLVLQHYKHSHFLQRQHSCKKSTPFDWSIVLSRALQSCPSPSPSIPTPPGLIHGRLRSSLRSSAFLTRPSSWNSRTSRRSHTSQRTPMAGMALFSLFVPSLSNAANGLLVFPLSRTRTPASLIGR